MENLETKTVEDIWQRSMYMRSKMLNGLEVLMNVDISGSNATEKELIYERDKMKLYHYTPRVEKTNKYPALIVYALVNKQYMMDLQEDKSLIRNMLDGGQDVYIIDWGYPTADDRYMTMGDYINGYIDRCVDIVAKRHNVPKINLLGVCQGGTFSLIYTALHQSKIKNLVTLVTPVDFSTNDGLLFKWGKYLDMDKIVEANGNVSGDFMNSGFLLLKPYELMVDKYVNLIDDLDDPAKISNFLRMEKWIFDSPDQVGATIQEFIKNMYHENKLAKGTYTLEDEPVDLKKITCPTLVILGKKDNQVPPAATRPIIDLIGSKDKELAEFDTGHIGIFVSRRSQKEVAPKINEFLNQRAR